MTEDRVFILGAVEGTSLALALARACSDQRTPRRHPAARRNPRPVRPPSSLARPLVLVTVRDAQLEVSPRPLATASLAVRRVVLHS